MSLDGLRQCVIQEYALPGTAGPKRGATSSARSGSVHIQTAKAISRLSEENRSHFSTVPPWPKGMANGEDRGEDWRSSSLSLDGIGDSPLQQPQGGFNTGVESWTGMSFCPRQGPEIGGCRIGVGGGPA